MKKIASLLILLLTIACNAAAKEKQVYQSESLQIHRVSPHVYLHVSYLETETWGKVSCNGMIVMDNGEAVVFDTTPDDKSSRELINWITGTLGCKIIAVIPTHYHGDNLGGLNEFNRQGVPSYAYRKTIEIAAEHDYPVPQYVFDRLFEMKVGDKKIYVEFPGEGHTCDNVIGYFPDENVMFGGCLIKETGAGKGNLEEANSDEWPGTVKRVKSNYPEVKIVIPGHGEYGGPELLDYTIGLFE